MDFLVSLFLTSWRLLVDRVRGPFLCSPNLWSGVWLRHLHVKPLAYNWHTHLCTSIHSLTCSPHCYNVTFGFNNNQWLQFSSFSYTCCWWCCCCLFVVCFSSFLFLQVLLTILCMATVWFLFSPQMQQLVTWFLAVGVYLFKFCLHSPSFFNFSFQTKLIKQTNNGIVGFGFAEACASEQKNLDRPFLFIFCILLTLLFSFWLWFAFNHVYNHDYLGQCLGPKYLTHLTYWMWKHHPSMNLSTES